MSRCTMHEKILDQSIHYFLIETSHFCLELISNIAIEGLKIIAMYNLKNLEI
jgi:hypothetical protein